MLLLVYGQFDLVLEEFPKQEKGIQRLIDRLCLTSNVIVDDLRNLSMISGDIRSLS